MKRMIAALLCVFVLAGCSESGNDDSSNHMNPSSTAATSFNASDTMFAQMMIPHHEQAVQMSEYAKRNTTNPDVLALADKIAAAQQPEIDLMGGWLHEWGIHDMDHMHMGDDGMLSDAEIEKLKQAKGVSFDKLFLTGMIAHHQGAVAMAQEVLRDGINADVKKLANDIVSTQTTEIATMQGLLNK